MHPYWLLIPSFVLCVIGSAATYTKFRDTWGFIPLMAVIGAPYAVLFAVAARIFKDSAKMYVYSLYADILMLVAYYLLPILFFNTKLTPGVAVGSAVILAGVLIVHIFG